MNLGKKINSFTVNKKKTKISLDLKKKQINFTYQYAPVLPLLHYHRYHYQMMLISREYALQRFVLNLHIFLQD